MQGARFKVHGEKRGTRLKLRVSSSLAQFILHSGASLETEKDLGDTPMKWFPDFIGQADLTDFTDCDFPLVRSPAHSRRPSEMGFALRYTNFTGQAKDVESGGYFLPFC